MPLQRPHLRLAIAVGMPGTEDTKEGGGLEGRIPRELLLDPGPVLGKGIRPGSMPPRRLLLAGKFAVIAARAKSDPGWRWWISAARCVAFGRRRGSLS